MSDGIIPIVIEESELNVADVEPSERFARLLKRIGDRTSVGSLGLGSIRTSVRERAEES